MLLTALQNASSRASEVAPLLVELSLTGMLPERPGTNTLVL